MWASYLICQTALALLWAVWMSMVWVCYSLLHTRDLVVRVSSAVCRVRFFNRKFLVLISFTMQY